MRTRGSGAGDKKGFLIALVALIVLTGAATLSLSEKGVRADGQTYYVASTGSDSNPGSEALPWRTIQKAANTLVAGDTVYLKAGTYHERVIPQNPGNATGAITYAAYPGAAVTIDGGGIILPNDQAGLFEVSNKSHIRISGLRVINAGPNADNAGILINNSSYITVERNSTYNTTSSGIGVWGSHHVVIDGNTVELACTGGYQECITVASTDTFEIKNNEVNQCQKESIDAKDGASNGKVYLNHVRNGQAVGIYVDAWDKHTFNIEVFQNVVHDISADGFDVASETGGLLENVSLYNNIAYHNRYVGVVISVNGPGGAQGQRPMNGVYVINNTLYDNGWQTWGGGILVENPHAQNVVIRNNIAGQNLYFQMAVDPSVTQTVTIDHNLIDGYRGTEGETYGSAYVTGNPSFVYAAGADFHLQGSSPAVDAGSASGAPSNDFDGTLRPQDGDDDGAANYDIGAYERPHFTVWVYLPTVTKH